MPTNGSKRILILGGGFAGLDAAQQLEKIFSKDDNVEITMVNQDNYLIFTSMIAEVVASSIDAKHIVIPIRECLSKASFKELEIRDIDLEKKVVAGYHFHSSEVFKLEYDYLILALGSMTGYHGVPGAEDYSFPLKNLSDAMILRSHVIDMFEYADLETDPELRRRLLKFVVVGGGYTGIEVAAELNDFVHSSRRFYKNIKADEVKVLVVDPGTRIMHEMSEGLADYGLNLLRKRGMEFLLQTRVKGVAEDRVEFQDGNHVETKTTIWAAGTSPQHVVGQLPCVNERGRIEVNEYLEVLNYPGVWALGDCAQVPDAKTGKPFPPTAQHATREGKRVAYNVAAAVKGKDQNKKAFKYKTMGMLAPLGHRSAVAQIMGLKFSGFFAWFLWRSIYLGKLPGFDRKMRVAIDWFLDMFLPRDIIQLKFLMRPKQSPPSDQ
ncbi:NAD(P)/FAD-dependent oxidoreductase [Desulfobacterota bacterium AH_259_B03_O07]|nr:NAD(P)/FAD-dependent oxidoreductase [Desulfobacterota bacterium AH_259_B03_O07]